MTFLRDGSNRMRISTKPLTFIGNVTQVTFLLVFFNHVPVGKIVELGLLTCPTQLTLSSSI